MSFNPNVGRNEYTANASQTVFTFDFKVFLNTDIQVYLTPTGNTPSDINDLLVLTTDYNIVISGDTGGTVTLTSAASAGDAVTLVRVLPISRYVEFQNNGDLLASTLNLDQDYQTYLTADQQVQESRHISIPQSAQGVSTDLPTPQPLKVLRWNSLANQLENHSIGDNDVFVNIKNIDSIAELSTTNPLIYSTINVRGYYTPNDGGGGIFNYDATQSAVNNGGTIINGWVRQYSESVNVRQFGAKGDGVTDDTSSISNAILASKEVEIPDGRFLIGSSLINLPYTLKSLYGKGTLLTQGNDALKATGEVLEANIPVTSITYHNTVAETTAIDYVDNYTKATVSLSDSLRINANDIVRLVGSSLQSYWAKVREVDTLTGIIILDRELNFSLGTTILLNVMSPFNIEISTNFEGEGVVGNVITCSLASGVVVKKCTFNGVMNCIADSGAFNIVEDCNFIGSDRARLGYNAGPNICKGNTITGMSQAFREVSGHGTRFERNIISNGVDRPYGLGIELTGDGVGTVKDKNCSHYVLYNEVYSAMRGVAGSGNGGIHLNFNGNYNKIIGNKSYYNSFGCYLENNCNSNLITNNDFSYNSAYYGTGLELDADCYDNIISNNTCNYNAGSTAAAESAGIEIRAGVRKPIPAIDNLPHPNKRNIIIGNHCSNNGLYGIKVAGELNAVRGNTLFNNGSARFSGVLSSSDLYITDAADCSISGNTIISKISGNKFSLYGDNSERILISENIIKTTGYQTSAIKFEGGALYTSSDITLSRNIINSISLQRGVHITGGVGLLLNNINAEDNYIRQGANGYAALEFDYINLYKIQNNTLPINTTITRALCTNRLGIASAVSDAVGADVTALKAELNTLLATLRAGSVINS